MLKHGNIFYSVDICRHWLSVWIMKLCIILSFMYYLILHANILVYLRTCIFDTLWLLSWTCYIFLFFIFYTILHFQLPQTNRDYLDQRKDKCLKLNQTTSETKPWSKNSLHLIFENIFNQMRKPQNNSDQSAFHLSAAHIDVQLILLMAVLEENITAYVTETIKHTYTHTHTVKKWTSNSIN